MCYIQSQIEQNMTQWFHTDTIGANTNLGTFTSKRFGPAQMPWRNKTTDSQKTARIRERWYIRRAAWRCFYRSTQLASFKIGGMEVYQAVAAVCNKSSISINSKQFNCISLIHTRTRKHPLHISCNRVGCRSSIPKVNYDPIAIQVGLNIYRGGFDIRKIMVYCEFTLNKNVLWKFNNCTNFNRFLLPLLSPVLTVTVYSFCQKDHSCRGRDHCGNTPLSYARIACSVSRPDRPHSCQNPTSPIDVLSTARLHCLITGMCQILLPNKATNVVMKLRSPIGPSFLPASRQYVCCSFFKTICKIQCVEIYICLKNRLKPCREHRR